MKNWLWLCCVLAACSAKKQEKPIPLNEMKVIVWDMIKAGEWFHTVSAKDSTAKKRNVELKMYSQVLTIHKLTRDQFYNSYKYYEAHPTQFKELVDSIDAYANREKNMENERRAKEHANTK